MADITDIHVERRRPPVRALHQPVEPAIVQALVCGRLLLEVADVVELTDRSVVLEVRDPSLALALATTPEVVVRVDLGDATTTLLTEPGRRLSDGPDSRRVEFVLRERR